MKITGRSTPVSTQEPVGTRDETSSRAVMQATPQSAFHDGAGPPVRSRAATVPQPAGESKQRPRTELTKLGARAAIATGHRPLQIPDGTALPVAPAPPSISTLTALASTGFRSANRKPPTDWQGVWTSGVLSKANHDMLAELDRYGLAPDEDHLGFGHADIARLKGALHELAGAGGEDFDDLWAGIHTACVVGSRKQLAAVVTLIDLKVLEPDRIGPDGRTMIHTFASLANGTPVRDAFKQPDDGYSTLDERASLLAKAGVDLNASIYEQRARFTGALREAGFSRPQINDMLAQYGLTVDARWKALRGAGASRWSSNTPAERQELIERTVRMYGSPLMSTLLLKETAPRGRDVDYSRIPAALALVRHGADLQRPLVREELSETQLPLYPLHAAAHLHTPELVQAFIDKQADLHIKDEQGDTALHWAVLGEQGAANVEAVVGALLDATDNALLGVANREKALPLHYALSRPDRAGLVKTLLDRSGPQAITAQTQSGETPLHVAARQPGNLAMIQTLLARGADAGIQLTTHGTDLVHEHDRTVSGNTLMSCTALHYAAAFARDADMAGELISAFHGFARRAFANQGHDAITAGIAADRATHDWINTKSYDEDTALHFAASSGNPALVDKLIAAGADVNPSRRFGDTPLAAAIKSGNHRIVARLLAAGASLDRDRIAMVHAAQSTNPNVLRTLLSHGGAHLVHLTTATGDTLLHFAAKTPHNAATIKVLLDAGANAHINARTRERPHDAGQATPLQMAAKLPGNHDVVKLLLEAGAASEIDSRNGDGETALQLAVQQPDSLQTIRLLLGAGAQPRPESDDQIPLLLHAAGHASEPEVIDTLLGARAHLHGKTWDGATVMHFAARSNHPAVVQKLFDAGAKAFVNTPMDDGLKPLHMAAMESRNPQVVAMLLEAGADPHAMLDGINCLHLAAKRFSEAPEIIELLVKAGVDIDRKAEPGELEFDEDDDVAAYYGKNPLQLAVREDSYTTALMLLKHGANPDVRDADGATLLHEHLKGHTRGAYFTGELIEAGVDPAARDNQGNTALHVYLASYWHDLDVVRTLLDNDVDVHARNHDNDTVLHIAVRSTSPRMSVDVVDALLKKGADVRQASGKNMNLLMEALTAIAGAESFDYPEIVAERKMPVMQRFLDGGVALEDVDDLGRTALHLALELNVTQLVPMLLAKHVDALVSNHHGVTALDLAARRKHEALTSPWRDISDTPVDVELEDSVIAAGEAQLARLKSSTTPFDVKAAALERMVGRLEKADPQNAHIEAPASVMLSPSGSDDEDPWNEARAQRARDRSVDQTRLANWNAFGRNVIMALTLHRATYGDVPAGQASLARLRNMLDRIPPAMRAEAG